MNARGSRASHPGLKGAELQRRGKLVGGLKLDFQLLAARAAGLANGLLALTCLRAAQGGVSAPQRAAN